MADKLTAKKPAGITPKELKRVLSDINRHKEHASENNGMAGQATKLAIETYQLNAKALTYVAGLVKKEPATGQTVARATVEMLFKAGLFDQMDQFDDALPMFRAIVEQLENTQPSHGTPSGKDGDDNMDDLLATGGQTH